MDHLPPLKNESKILKLTVGEIMYRKIAVEVN